MNEELRVDTTLDPALKVEGEGSFTVPTYDVPDEDKALAAEILAMDPLKDVPSPFRGLDGKKVPEPTLSALPPAMREQIEARLAMVLPSKRAETERELVRKALTENSMAVRASAGVGASALPVHKTMAEVAAQHRQLGREFDSLSADLARVLRHDSAVDKATGELKPVPVYQFEGPAREKIIRQQEELLYRMKLLEGVEGERRMQKAMLESIEAVKRLRAAQAENAEVDKRAAEAVREERIKLRVEARAKTLENTL